jgi:hypothetical protein
LTHAGDDVEHTLCVSVRRVEDEDVDVRGDERFGTLHGVLRIADRGADAQPAEGILRSVGVLHRFLDVLHGDEPLQPVLLVDDQELLDLVLVQDFPRGVERRADRNREQRLARHHFRDRPVDVRLESQIPVGEDADEPPFLAAVLGDRDTGDGELLHQIERFVNAVILRERDRVDDHPALGPLDAIDLGGLLLNRHVLVDDAEAAVLCHRNRQPRLGDRVHRGAHERHVQTNALRELRADVHLPGQDRRVLWDEEDVVEGERRLQLLAGSRGAADGSEAAPDVFDVVD